MWPVSARFLATLNRPHDVVSKVEVLQDGAVEAVIEGRTVFDAAGNETGAVTGRVDVARQVVRRRGSLTFVDLSGSSALTANDAHDLLVPLVSEVRPWRGVRYWDATAAERAAGTDVEYVPLGTLVLYGVRGEYPTVQVAAYDRMWDIVRRRFVGSYPITAGTPLSDVISDVITSRMPASRLALDIPTTADTAPGLVWDELDDPGAKLTDLATAAGQQLYVDVMGTFRMTPEPVASPDAVVFTYTTGANSNMARPEREFDAQTAVNAIVARGTAADAPASVVGYAQDDDPESLTYVGRIGVIPDPFNSPLLTSTGQANLAATTVLQRSLGLADTVSVRGMPNPALDSGDVLRVEDDAQGLAAEFVADGFPIGMQARDGFMAVDLRSRVLRLTSS